MKLSVNNSTNDWNNVKTVSDLLTQLELSTTGIAIAVNNNVIPKDEQHIFKLKENDKILIIKAAQGG